MNQRKDKLTQNIDKKIYFSKQQANLPIDLVRKNSVGRMTIVSNV